MALTKECTLASLVVISHFEISSIYFVPAKNSATVEINGYLSAAAMSAGAMPAWKGTFNWNTTGGQLAPQIIALAQTKLSEAIDAGQIK